MKHFITIFLISSVVNLSCSGQRLSEAKVPSVVVNTVRAKFPAAAEVEWKKSNELYEAAIETDRNRETTVRIDAAGKLVMQKQEIDQEQLLPTVLTFVKQNYAGYAIDDLHKIENQGKVYYQVDLDARRKKDVQLVFSSEGKADNSVAYWD